MMASGGQPRAFADRNLPARHGDVLRAVLDPALLRGASIGSNWGAHLLVIILNADAVQGHGERAQVNH